MPRSSGVPGAGVPRNTGSRHPVEPHTRKRKRSPSDDRRDDRRVVNQIQAKAHKRHEAWVDGGQRNVVASLTTDLEELFDDRRDDQAGTLHDPYRGRTWIPR